MRQSQPPDTAWDEQSSPAIRLLRHALLESTLDFGYWQQLCQLLSQEDACDKHIVSINALPGLTCEANRGDYDRALPVTTAWNMLRLAAKLLDDVEDGETNQPAKITNIATGLLFLAQLALGTLTEQNVSLDLTHELNKILCQTGLRACAGQHVELAARDENTVLDPDTWLQIALAKSGKPCAWASWAGASLPGASEEILACYREYGSRLGVLLQIADDFNGIWHPSGRSDLAAGQTTLPVCYARQVTKGLEREHLEVVLERAAQGHPDAQVHAQELLMSAGAQDYMLVAARVQYMYAVEALGRAHCTSPHSDRLIALLNQVMPVLVRAKDRAND